MDAGLERMEDTGTTDHPSEAFLNVYRFCIDSITTATFVFLFLYNTPTDFDAIIFA
jgi:hypothetical protein